VLDADIGDYSGNMSNESTMMFNEHREADHQILCLIQKMAERRYLRKMASVRRHRRVCHRGRW
jgi:hypothetical protein